MITVYLIKDILEGLVVYVGKTSNFNRRKREHFTLHSKNTKDWISAIGTNNIEITPIECFDSEEEALKREDELILQYDTINNGYNKHRSGLIKAGRENEYKKEWYQEHPEKKKEQNKKWLQNNPEYQKQYYQDNSEEIKERSKQYRQDNREKCNEYQKEYQRDVRAAKKLGMTVAEYRQNREG